MSNGSQIDVIEEKNDVDLNILSTPLSSLPTTLRASPRSSVISVQSTTFQKMFHLFVDGQTFAYLVIHPSFRRAFVGEQSGKVLLGQSYHLDSMPHCSRIFLIDRCSCCLQTFVNKQIIIENVHCHFSHRL